MAAELLTLSAPGLTFRDVAVLGRYRIDWIEGTNHLEDIEWIPGTRWLLASGMSMRWLTRGAAGAPGDPGPGRLYLVDTDRRLVCEAWPAGGDIDPSDEFDRTDPVPRDRFAPQGISVGEDPRGSHGRLYVVNHGARESIEVFRISSDGDAPPALTWVGAVERRPGTEGNAVAALPDGGVIASYYPPGLAFRTDLHDGQPHGGVERWTRGRGWADVPGLEAGFPNGLAVSADGTTFFLADSTGFLRRVRAADGLPTVIPLPVTPDNLRWTADGRLLTTGVRAAALDQIVAACTAQPPLPLEIAVLAIDPDSLEIEAMIDESASFGLPTTAVADGADLYLTSLLSTRLAHLTRDS